MPDVEAAAGRGRGLQVLLQRQPLHDVGRVVAADGGAGRRTQQPQGRRKEAAGQQLALDLGYVQSGVAACSISFVALQV